MLINPYCSNRGWLFEDTKEALGRCEGATYLERDEHGNPHLTATPEVDVRPTDDPLPNADAWICIRTDEWTRCPDPQRLVLMLHDFWQHDLPTFVGALSCVHPDQPKANMHHPEETGICTRRGVLTQPIGARKAFKLRETMPGRFCVGWTGRNMHNPAGEDCKRPHLLAEALEIARREIEVDCIWLSPDALSDNFSVEYEGSTTHHWQPDRGPRRTPSLEQLQRFYDSIDVLVVTSLPEPGPLSKWEALACGCGLLVPLETDLRPQYDPLLAYAYDSSEYMAECLMMLSERRGDLFDGRAERRAGLPWQEDWLAANIRLAVEVASG